MKISDVWRGWTTNDRPNLQAMAIAMAPAAILLFSACAPVHELRVAGGGGEAPAESRKLSRFVYIEEGTDLVLTIGVRAAAFHEDDPYFPLEISLTNRLKGVTWVLTRESFSLVDGDGTVYDLPTQKELLSGYTKRTFDTRLFEARSVTASKHEGFRQVESNFFPDPVRGIIREPDTVSGSAGVATTSTSLIPIERVEIAARTFMEDVLYFPHPEGKLLEATFSLEIRAQGLSEPARIAFTIPRIK
ncbi:MAG: hypothetical protein E2P03_01675 [Acidobacteria bacterium]|nr:MAG: hypothetical protein E2P03_01675 [Acidobacteriota bacterium]